MRFRAEPLNYRRQKSVALFFFYCLLTTGYWLLPTVSAQREVNSSSAQRSSSTPQTTGLNQWGAVTLFHGLPSDRVRAIAQDSDGAMWFGTDGGLAKYDGRRTQAIVGGDFTRERVLALKFDAEGVLWIGTEDGATRLVGGAEFRPVKETEGRAVTAILTPERGRAVLASEQGLIFDCRVQTDGSLITRTTPAQPLTSADSDRPGPLRLTSLAFVNQTLMAGTLSRGLMAFERAQLDAFKEVQSRPRAFFIYALELDGAGRLWFGAKAKNEDSGLYQSDDLLHPLKVGSGTGTVVALRADAQGGLWVGTDGRGVFHFDHTRTLREHFTFEGTAGGLRSDRVYSIFVDREDVVWFGTDKGVCRYDPHALRVEDVSADPTSNFVRTLYRASDGRLMCGTNRGLLLNDAASSRWLPVTSISNNAVYAIVEERDGRVLTGTANGLYSSASQAREINEGTRFTRIGAEDTEAGASDSVRAIARFQGATYIATYGRGLERVDGTRRTLVWPTVDATDAHVRDVVSLYADAEGGKLWIGTAGAGVFIFDGKQVSKDPALEKLGRSVVWGMDSSGDGWFWFATGNGLYLYRPNDLMLIAPNLDARSVVSTGARTGQSRQAWCATSGGGLLRILLDEQFGPIISRFDAEQGLPSQNAFAVLPINDSAQPGDETLLIGTNRGLARYTPGRSAPNLAPTRIISRRIHQAEELRAGLSLEYPQNSLVLDVAAASSRTFPEQFQYAFLLFDSAGQIVKKKFSHDAQLTLASLRPGRYRVVARAYNVDLIASNPLEFEFSVAGAPFPRTIVALSVLLALALAALWWGYFQNRRMARTSTELMEANRQLATARLQVANQTEVERRRIARDLHDQTLADLRHLLLLTDQLSTNGTEGDHGRRLDPATFRAEIESISTEVRRICEDLSPSVLENVGFAAALEWAISNAVTHSPPDCKFEYEFTCAEDLEERIELAVGVRMQVYRILQEAVSNVCRHAAATFVRLSLSLTDDGAFLLRLEDDGRDFNPLEKRPQHGRGLTNIRARASLIEAEVSWSKRHGGGTVFTLSKANAVKEPGVEL